MTLKVINKQYNLGNMEQEGVGEAQGVPWDQLCYINFYIHVQINLKKKFIGNINKRACVWYIQKAGEAAGNTLPSIGL